MSLDPGCVAWRASAIGQKRMPARYVVQGASEESLHPRPVAPAFETRSLLDAPGAEVVIKRAEQAFDGIDILVNNAGGSNSAKASGWFETPIEDWADSYRQNTLPAVRLAQAFVPGVRERKWGRVIQISSRNAISAYAQFGPYGAAKAAVNNLTLSLSKALAGTGVTSNGIMPGLICTPLVDPWFKNLAKQLGSEDLEIGRDFALKSVLQQTVARRHQRYGAARPGGVGRGAGRKPVEH